MKPTLEWLKNPEIFEVNREKAHTDHLCTVNGQQLKQSLNGTWKFNYCEHPDNRPADFYMVDFDVTNFDDIKVPGHLSQLVLSVGDDPDGKVSFLQCTHGRIHPFDRTGHISTQPGSHQNTQNDTDGQHHDQHTVHGVQYFC